MAWNFWICSLNIYRASCSEIHPYQEWRFLPGERWPRGPPTLPRPTFRPGWRIAENTNDRATSAFCNLRTRIMGKGRPAGDPFVRLKRRIDYSSSSRSVLGFIALARTRSFKSGLWIFIERLLLYSSLVVVHARHARFRIPLNFTVPFVRILPAELLSTELTWRVLNARGCGVIERTFPHGCADSTRATASREFDRGTIRFRRWTWHFRPDGNNENRSLSRVWRRWLFPRMNGSSA